MATLNIGGKAVTVDDSFLKLSPDQQNAQVEEIAKSMGIGGAPTSPQPGTAAYAANIQGLVDAGQPTPQPASPPPEWTPPDNLPASARAFSDHAIEGIPVAGPLLSDARNTIWNDPSAVAMRQAQGASADAQSPAAAVAGDVFGTVAPMMAAGGFIPGAAKVLGMEGPLALRAGAGAASSGVIGGVDALARGEDPRDALVQGVADAAIGGALPFAGAAAGKILAGAPKVPGLDSLQAIKNAMYARADNLGVRYSPQGYRDMAGDMVVDANAGHISPDRHPIATSMLKDVVQKPPTYSPTLTQLDQLRQVVRRDVANNADDAEAHFGRGMISNIDNFIDNASGAQVASGSGADAAEAITAARQSNSVYRKSEQVADALETAQRRAASTGSGGNVNNAVRQNIRKILDAGAPGYTDEEKAAMEGIVRGGPISNAMRLVGKLSPVGNGLMAALGIGGAAANPLLATVPAIGAAAKFAADRDTTNKARLLQALIANGGKKLPARSPIASAMLSRVGGPVAATQLENRASGGPDPIARALLAALGQ